jgi:DNA polymerase elongation subunit (family B)
MLKTKNHSKTPLQRIYKAMITSSILATARKTKTTKRMKDKILSEEVKTILRHDIPLRHKIAQQLGIEQTTVYSYVTRPEREKALIKYPIVIDILKKHTGFRIGRILISKKE